MRSDPLTATKRHISFEIRRRRFSGHVLALTTLKEVPSDPFIVTKRHLNIPRPLLSLYTSMDQT